MFQKLSSVRESNFGILQTQKNIVTGQFHFSEEFFENCPDNAKHS